MCGYVDLDKVRHSSGWDPGSFDRRRFRYTHVSHGIQLQQREAKHCSQLEGLRCSGHDRRVVLGNTLSDLLRRTPASSLAMESAVPVRRCGHVCCYGTS